MNILHCCLSSFYIDGYNYQENLLSRQNKLDGNDVTILASTESFQDNKTLGYIKPGSYINQDGIKVIRVPYKKIFNAKIRRKIRAYEGVFPILKECCPDVIVFHGMAAWELLTVIKYIRKNGNVKLYIDNHANYYNSASDWLSLHILHRGFYRAILKKAFPFTERVLCIGFREMRFAKEVYDAPERKLLHYPLGGFIADDEEYTHKRNEKRKNLGISGEKIVFLHSGKMDAGKKTCELLRAFEAVKDSRFCLLIAGNLLDDIKEEAERLIALDFRIQYLGWQNGEELLSLLCAADVYLQPGTPSSTLQNAMCSRCAIMAQPIREYKYFLQDYGFYVNNEDEIYQMFENIATDNEIIMEYVDKTFKRAQELLDYKVLAKVLYQ